MAKVAVVGKADLDRMESAGRLEVQPRLNVSHVFREDSGHDVHAAGEDLAQELLADVKGQPHPLVLLLVFATPDFQDYQRLLAGIRSTKDDRTDLALVPLVGCSVAACVVGDRLRERGAVLVGLCSDAITARTAVAENAVVEPQAAVNDILGQLSLADLGVDFNPNGNRLALMLLPGFKENPASRPSYSDPEVHHLFCQATNSEIPVVGGSPSAGVSVATAGWHFYNDRVYRNALVTALLECDVQFGAAMGGGLKETGKFVHISDLDESDNRTVRVLDGGETPAAVLDRHGNDAVFGAMNMEGDPTVLYPMRDDDNGSVWFLRDIANIRRLQVLEFDYETAVRAVDGLFQLALRRGAMRTADLAVALAFVCTSRLQLFSQDRSWIKTAIGKAADGLRGKPILAVYVNGECGIDSSGRLVQNNMQASSLLLGRSLSTGGQMRRGAKVLADASRAMLNAKTVAETIDVALNDLEIAGFKGAMLSLIYEESQGSGKKQRWIVAQDSLGEQWKKIVDLTRRVIGGNDVLANVYDEGHARFVPDSRQEESLCEPKSARIAGVISQFIKPLRSNLGHIIGILQVDLGDLSHLKKLPPSLWLFLQSYANQVGAALARAMYQEQVSIGRELDRAVAEAMACDTIEAAADTFLKITAGAFGVEMAHVRIPTHSEKYLEMIGAFGKYGETARKGDRKRIRTEDGGPSACCFREYRPGEIMVVNDTVEDSRAEGLLLKYGKKTAIGHALRDQRAFANTPVFDENSGRRLGVLNIATVTPWRISQHTMDALADAGRQLAFLLISFDAKQKPLKEIEFLNAAVPQIWAHETFPEALDRLAESLKVACRARYVSIFRWDEERRVLVLAAQRGWFEPDVLGKAIYSSGEGMTGGLVNMPGVLVVPNREEMRKMLPSLPKYELPMLGQKWQLKSHTFEVIGFRLRAFDKTLGAIVLHNPIPRDEVGESHFTTTDQQVLEQVQAGLSLYMYSLLGLKADRREQREQACLADLGRRLLQPGGPADVLNGALVGLAESQKVEAIGILLGAGSDCGELRLVASYGHPESIVGATFHTGESPVTDAFTRQEPVELVRSTLTEIRLKFQKEFERTLPSHQVKSFLALPLTFMGDKLGVLSWINLDDSALEGDRVKRSRVRFFERIAGRLSTSLQSSEIHRLEREKKEATEELVKTRVAAAEAIHPVARPLRNASLIVEHLKKSPLAEDVIEEISQIQCEVREGLRRYRNLLQYLEGWRERRIENLGLCGLVNEVIDRHIKRSSQELVHVERNVRYELLVRVCRREMLQILETLVSNAEDAVEGTGTLTVTTEYDTGKQLGFLTLADTGPGMTDEQVSKAFQGFYTTKTNGSGLGLMIARSMAKRNGAELILRQRKQKGLEAILCLPAKQVEIDP